METMEDRLAAIDVGTNSIHLIVVKIKEDGSFEIIDREKEVIRLGEGSGGDIKFILDDAASRAVDALKRFKGIAESHNARIRAVATSAVREAHNKNDFINKVYDKTGIEIEVISGYEEARLIYLGILKAVPAYDKKTLVIDIGGGSTEFLLGLKGQITFSVSLKVGAVRMTSRFFPDYVITDEAVRECRKWVEGEIYHAAELIKREGFELAVGSSGTIMSAGLMIDALRKGGNETNVILNNFDFTKEELEAIRDEILRRKTVEKRKKIPGLDEKRADIIPAGIIILSTIFRLLKLEKMTISGYALREGIVIDWIEKKRPEKIKSQFVDIRKESVKSIAASCSFDREHCNFVATLALKIFDGLRHLHGLQEECREYLEAAARLHDIGYHISHTNHHYHSYYIIRNSELLGFNENEISIIAHTARYHRKSHPKPAHEDFSALPERTRDVIRKLSAILRIADSLDRRHKRCIEDLEVAVENKSVKLLLQVKNGEDVDIELWNLERRKLLFEEVFGKKLIAALL